ncbi:MAG TPA: AraC family ligand binding domain-containing protein [Miltoncostaea sp.]|nr:AraC family ligand binding domain-containing protein [Miltoncostaea sp.]
MPRTSRETASKGGDYGVVVDRAEELGEYTVSFTLFREDVDAGPLMRGLPDDRCQCPHWGYVLTGRVTIRYADGEEELVAGDAFYLPPGHVPVSHEPGSEAVMFSPTDALRATEEAMARNMEAMGA